MYLLFTGHFDGHADQVVRYREHHPVQQVYGYPRCHWTPPSGEYAVVVSRNSAEKNRNQIPSGPIYYIRADYNNLEILGQKWRALTNYLALTGIRLWCHIIWHHLNFELRDCLITFPIFVLSQCLIARNVRELFSFNRGVRI
jgi:hypothetical protein